MINSVNSKIKNVSNLQYEEKNLSIGALLLKKQEK